MWARRFLMLVLSATIAAPSLAFDRPFPEGTKRGTMKPAPYPSVIIDGKARRLSVGARIWNRDNLTQVPASLPPAEFVVNYTEDTQGQIDRIWILRPDEVRKPLPK